MLSYENVIAAACSMCTFVRGVSNSQTKLVDPWHNGPVDAAVVRYLKAVVSGFRFPAISKIIQISFSAAPQQLRATALKGGTGYGLPKSLG